MNFDQACEVSFPGGYQQAATTLVSNATRVIRLYAPTLEAEICGAPELVEALSSMLRANRQAQARILTSLDGVSRGKTNPLVELARNLSSLCSIRVLSEPPDRFKADYLLADRNGLVFRKSQQEMLAWFDPDTPADVLPRLEHFDYLWQRAQSHPELRQLTL